MSARNRLENKRKRREEREARKAKGHLLRLPKDASIPGEQEDPYKALNDAGFSVTSTQLWRPDEAES